MQLVCRSYPALSSTSRFYIQPDFAQERKWKLALAKKASRNVVNYHARLKNQEVRKAKMEESNIRKMAAAVSREIKRFWLKIEKVVRHKHCVKVKEKKKEALNRHFEYLVSQTEAYSSMLAKDLSR